MHIARSYSGYGLPIGDLVQEGNIGLMKAVKRFDPTVGVRLVSFAVHWIKAEIHRICVKELAYCQVGDHQSATQTVLQLKKNQEKSGLVQPGRSEKRGRVF